MLTTSMSMLPFPLISSPSDPCLYYPNILSLILIAFCCSYNSFCSCRNFLIGIPIRGSWDVWSLFSFPNNGDWSIMYLSLRSLGKFDSSLFCYFGPLFKVKLIHSYLIFFWSILLRPDGAVPILILSSLILTWSLVGADTNYLSLRSEVGEAFLVWEIPSNFLFIEYDA